MNKRVGNGALRTGQALTRTGAALCAAVLLVAGCDGDNLFGGGGSSLDTTPPEFSILDPRPFATHPLNQSIVVRIHATDPSGIKSASFVGRVHRGNRDLGTDSMAVVFPERTTLPFSDPLPTDTTLLRFLEVARDVARSNETVWLVVSVTDGRDNLKVDSVAIRVGGPHVRILSPPDSSEFSVGQELPIHILASDSTSEIATLVLTRTGPAGSDTLYQLNFPTGRTVVDTVLSVALPVVGNFTFIAAARNGEFITGMDSIHAAVTTSVTADVTPPLVRIVITERSRMELGDRMGVTVFSRDNPGTGLTRVGVTVVATNLGTTTVVQSLVFDTILPAPKPESRDSFFIAPFNLDPLVLPDTLAFQIYAFAIDANGNCAAAIDSVFQSLACQAIAGLNANGFIAANVVAPPISVVAVSGRTVQLSTGGFIADAVVDTDPTRPRLYLSNIGKNKVDMLDLASMTFTHEMLVGSKPWGLAINGPGDTLMVANSGGTNISFLYLAVPQPLEDVNRRLLTPNTVLYELQIKTDETGATRYAGKFYDFSDRPQFLAQDSVGRIVYSTVPTPAAQLGTIRVAETGPGWQRPEVRILFNDNAIRSADNSVVLANIDSLVIIRRTDSDRVILFDHVSGFPSSPLQSSETSVDLAADELRALGSDVFFGAGTWVLDSIGLSDTTFVAASGDRGWVAFGEGATQPTGRIMLWNAAAGGVTGSLQVNDLVANASERVNGVGLNLNGSLGVARGESGAYFFTPDLRLQGEYALDREGHGAAMHPLHSQALGSSATSVAFVGTGRHSIKIIDTFHFFDRGEIHTRDNISGPLRASLPLATDNVGVDPSHPDYIVVKLYAITTNIVGGQELPGVVVINVRNRDLN